MSNLVPAVAEVKTEVPKKQVSGEFFVFFAGQTISDQFRNAIPFFRFGGTLRVDSSKCLQYRSGYVRRCEITQLRIYWQSEHINNVNPNERKHLAPIYELTENGKTRTIGIDPKTKMHDGLLRFPFYPSMEIDILTSKGDGLVKMPCTSPKEALEAQKFLFPDWGEVFVGNKSLPEKTTALKKYFEERQKIAQTKFEKDVVEAAILSCDQYIDWCNRTAASANAEFGRMQAAGKAWVMGMDAEAAFRDSVIQRRDTVQQNQQDQIKNMTEAITKMAEVVAGNKGPAVQSEITEDPLYKEFLEFKKWKEGQSAQESAEPTTTYGENGQCNATTVKGERCKSGALENGYCANPSHQAQSAVAA